MTDDRTPLDVALDIVFYAPVGLALTVSEELPKLAAKGRSRLGGQVATARVVGQFAVAQGRRQVQQRAGLGSNGPRRAPAPSAPVPDPAATPAPGRSSVPDPGAGAPVASPPAGPRPALSADPDTNGSGPSPAADDVVGAQPTPAPPSVRPDELAIPGYDSLSASQVVQRLAGLAPAELEAVRAYEAAHRNRRTILARVAQLQGS